MTAPKGRKRWAAKASSNPSERPSKSSNPAASGVNLHLRKAVRHFLTADRTYLRIVHAIRQQARRARKQGHPVEAAVFERIATLLSIPVRSADEFRHNLNVVSELISWLPFGAEFKDLSLDARKACGTVFILKQGFDPPTREQLVREMTTKPGRPQTTRGFAIRAMELNTEGKPWDEVAKNLPCDWAMVDDPGNCIRREVQLLRRSLKKCGVHLDVPLTRG